MKLKTTFLVCATLLSTSMALAEDPRVLVVEKVVERDSSAFHRLNKKFTFQYQPWGLGPTSLTTQGFVAGYHLSSDQVLQVEVSSGYDKWSGLSSNNRAEGKTAGIFYKQFSGNSFYFKGGLDYSTYDRSYNYMWLNGTPTDGYSYKGSKVSASLSIGNQWQWDNFTIGCDWIGIAMPITSESHDERIWGDDTDYAESQLEDSKKTYLKNGFPLALHLFVGASF